VDVLYFVGVLLESLDPLARLHQLRLFVRDDLTDRRASSDRLVVVGLLLRRAARLQLRALRPILGAAMAKLYQPSVR
jgi:hypothetical protein